MEDNIQNIMVCAKRQVSAISLKNHLEKAILNVDSATPLQFYIFASMKKLIAYSIDDRELLPFVVISGMDDEKEVEMYAKMLLKKYTLTHIIASSSAGKCMKKVYTDEFGTVHNVMTICPENRLIDIFLRKYEKKEAWEKEINELYERRLKIKKERLDF